MIMAVKDFSEENIPAIWRDYLFITEEAAKFIGQQDMEMVAELLKQRDQMQLTIDKGDYTVFCQSGEGKRFLHYLAETNSSMTQHLQHNLNTVRRQREVSESYGGFEASGTRTREWNT